MNDLQPDMPGLLGDSPAMVKLRNSIFRIADMPLPIMISGETGTGKEVAARTLHTLSNRKGQFIPVDCAALSSSLIESELFGHERGAFTGASSKREGLVHAAQGGTFFLDEIGELPLETQTRLLRLLEQRTYRPVGSQKERASDIRVIAATWRNLREEVSKGRFREDLYHRLSVLELRMPPLRERAKDIGELFDHFVAAQATAVNRVPPKPDMSVRVHLRRWPWPGNVRELRNVAQYCSAMTQGRVIGMDDLPPTMHRPPPEVPESDVHVGLGVTDIRIDLDYMEARRLFMDAFQQRYVSAILDAHDGNISAAARAAGMDRRSIQRILKRAQQIADGELE